MGTGPGTCPRARRAPGLLVASILPLAASLRLRHVALAGGLPLAVAGRPGPGRAWPSTSSAAFLPLTGSARPGGRANLNTQRARAAAAAPPATFSGKLPPPPGDPWAASACCGPRAGGAVRSRCTGSHRLEFAAPPGAAAAPTVAGECQWRRGVPLVPQPGHWQWGPSPRRPVPAVPVSQGLRSDSESATSTSAPRRAKKHGSISFKLKGQCSGQPEVSLQEPGARAISL